MREDGAGMGGGGEGRAALVILFDCVNQILPSGPDVIPMGILPTVGMGNSVTAPAVVILPSLGGFVAIVNHRLPSGPDVIPYGPNPIPIGSLPDIGTGK